MHYILSLPQHGHSAFFSSHSSSQTTAGHTADSPTPVQDSMWPLTPPWNKIQRFPHAPVSLSIPVTVKECTKVWQNSTSNSSADRLWQPCLKVGLSKSGSVALIHYCMLKGKERCLKRQKNPTASLSVNTLKLFSATAIQPSLFQKITTLNTFYKHRVELHLQDYSESHCRVVLEEALKAWPRTV